MKQVFLYFIIFTLIGFGACKPPFDTTPPNCDNTTNKCTIDLNWSNTYYNCNKGPYASVQPPFATNTNYTNTASATNAIASTDATKYLCQINVKNDEPAQSPCSQYGIGVTYWKTPGISQTIDVFTRFDFDVIVDYYEPVDNLWCNDGRPYFAGTVGLPGGVTSYTVPMFTQANYIP